VKFPAVLILIGLFTAQGAFAADFNHHSQIWQGAMVAFERRDQTNPPPTNGIEFIGSSTIARWKTLESDFTGYPVYNRGFGGSQLADSTYYAARIIFPYAPRMIFLRAGGNDIAAGESPEEVFSDFTNFVITVRAKLPDTTIVFISWGPTPSRWKQHDQELELNRRAKEYIAAHSEWHLEYIETYDLPLGTDGLPRPELFGPDKLHFNAAGYKLLAERVRPYLIK
jgi:hypothetical protein